MHYERYPEHVERIEMGGREKVREVEVYGRTKKIIVEVKDKGQWKYNSFGDLVWVGFCFGLGALAFNITASVVAGSMIAASK